VIACAISSIRGRLIVSVVRRVDSLAVHTPRQAHEEDSASTVGGMLTLATSKLSKKIDEEN
jgi:hypothetical protein